MKAKNKPEIKELSSRLQHLGETVSDYVLRHRDPLRDFEESGFEGGDTIFSIDRLVEPVITNVVNSWPDKIKPIVVVAEGMGADGTFSLGDQSKRARYRLLLDPIDGTRGLMYDKRSAWFLGAIALNNETDTTLADVLASTIVEIPTSKQYLADSFSTYAESPTMGVRRNVLTNERMHLDCRSSTNTNLQNSFSQVSNFFPGTKVLASELMELISSTVEAGVEEGHALIFDDQYISTGGQFVQLMCGKDRFCCDLRPLFYQIHEKQTGEKPILGLQCHPYDVAGLLAAKNSGVVVTDGWGKELNAPFDVHTPVHWCGYANSTLQSKIQPVIRRWLSEKLGC